MTAALILDQIRQIGVHAFTPNDDRVVHVSEAVLALRKQGHAVVCDEVFDEHLRLESVRAHHYASCRACGGAR